MANSLKIVKDIHKAFAEIKAKEMEAVAEALTEVGKDCVEQLGNEVKRIFDRPTKFIVKGFYSTKATNKKMYVRVGIKDWYSGREEVGSSSSPLWSPQTSARTVLQPHIEGGGRFIKGSESQLRNAGMLKSDEYIVPGGGLRLDPFGNVRGSYMIQILSSIGAFQWAGYDANITPESIERRKRSKKKKIRMDAKWMSNTFVVRSGIPSHLKPGIYVRKGKRGISPLFLFVKKTNYKKRFDFEKIVIDMYNKRFPKEVREEIARKLS